MPTQLVEARGHEDGTAGFWTLVRHNGALFLTSVTDGIDTNHADDTPPTVRLEILKDGEWVPLKRTGRIATTGAGCNISLYTYEPAPEQVAEYRFTL